VAHSNPQQPPRDEEPEAPAADAPPDAPEPDEDDPFDDPNRNPTGWSAMRDAAEHGLDGIKMVE